MTQLLERVKPSIQMTNFRLDNDPDLSRIIGERVVTNRRYVAEISRNNAERSTDQILAKSPILLEKVRHGDVILIPALFDVDSGYVIFGLQK